MALPSGYTHLVGLYLASYLDTGVYPSDDLEIEYLYSGIQGGYVFGARNTNSNTSAGQYNLYVGANATSYFGFRSARVNIGTFTQGAYSHFYGLNESMQLNTGNYLITAQGSAGTFTGTRTIWLGGMNNAGSINGQTKYAVYGMSIKQGGTLIRNYIPCVSPGNQVGLYDTVNENFTSLSTPESPTSYYLVTINDNTGGKGFAKTILEEKTKLIYGGMSSLLANGKYQVNLIAEAEDGYEFVNWTDGNGNIVSTEQDFQYKPTADITITPNFQKVTDIVLNMNHTLKVYVYGSYTQTIQVSVKSASVKTDALQKSTSTFVLEEIPSLLTKGCFVSLHTPKGKHLYIGYVTAIEGNTITCREPLAIFDQDYVFLSSLDTTNGLLTNFLDYLMARADSYTFGMGGPYDLEIARKLANVKSIEQIPFTSRTWYYSLDHNRNPNFTTPAIDQTEIRNLEEYLLQVFNDYGLYIDTREYLKNYVMFTPFYYRLGDTFSVSDNYEDVTDVNVIYEDQEANFLIVFNSTASTLRGIYGVKNDGSIEEYSGANYTDLLAYNDYKNKVVLSDDNIIDIVNSNLSNGHLNHKITFNVAFGGLYRAEEFYIGRPIQFYVGDKLYQSVITSVAFDIAENQEKIIGAKITIGKVRTNLTSKLNLGKVK